MPPRTSEIDEKAQKERYLRALEKTGTLTSGCKAARVSPNTVYKWREMDDAFVISERLARDVCADELEASVIRRARGRSDVLAMFMLKAMRPAKYRDNSRVEMSGPDGNPIEHRVYADLSDSELDARISALETREGRALSAPRGTSSA